MLKLPGLLLKIQTPGSPRARKFWVFTIGRNPLEFFEDLEFKAQSLNGSQIEIISGSKTIKYYLSHSTPLVLALSLHLICALLLILIPQSHRPQRLSSVSVDLIQTPVVRKIHNKPNSVSADENSNANSTTQAQKRVAQDLIRGLKVRQSAAVSRLKSGLGGKSFGTTRWTTNTQRALGTWSVNSDDTESGDKFNLSEMQVSEAFERIHSKMRECYEDLLVKDPHLSGQPQLFVDINRAGHVSNLNIRFLKAQSTSLYYMKSCLMKAFQSLRLPEKPSTDFQVVHTLVLARE